MEKKNKDFQLQKGSVKKIGHRVSGRVSDDAVLRVIMEEEERMMDVFVVAKELASHAGRETITEDDVRLAYKYI